MSTADSGYPAPARLHALDAVRGFALLLGIVFHATLSFVPTVSRYWVVVDNRQSIALALLFFVTHVFRMTTFFLIAGFFAHMSFHRRGARGFIMDRARRIALPLLIGWPLIFGAFFAIVQWDAGTGHPGSPASRPWPTLPNFPLTHLWFLYVLLELYVASLLLRFVVGLIDPAGRYRAIVDRLIRRIMESLWAPAILALPLAISFVANPRWLIWFGIPTPDLSFVTNSTAAIGFGTAFGVGWLLHRQIDLLDILQRRCLLYLSLAIAWLAACVAIAGVTASTTPIQDVPTKLLGAACYACATWTTTFAVIGLALRFLSGFSAARRYIADASYWLYLIHLPVVLLLQVIVARLDWPWPVKFFALLAIAFPLMFASYHYLVRFSFIGAVLNGTAMRPTRPRSALTASFPPS